MDIIFFLLSEMKNVQNFLWNRSKNLLFVSKSSTAVVAIVHLKYEDFKLIGFIRFVTGGWGISDHGAAIGSASFNPGWLIPAACWWASHVHYRYWKCRVSTTILHRSRFSFFICISNHVSIVDVNAEIDSLHWKMPQNNSFQCRGRS